MATVNHRFTNRGPALDFRWGLTNPKKGVIIIIGGKNYSSRTKQNKKSIYTGAQCPTEGINVPKAGWDYKPDIQEAAYSKTAGLKQNI